MTTKNVQQVLGKVLNGVCIIGAGYNDKVNGMTAAWVSQVSFDPVLVMAAVGKERHTHKMIEKSGVFSISVLYENQIDLAKHFGFKSGKDIDKFTGVPYETNSTACPVLKDCLAYLDCKVVGSYQAGDHTLFIAEILSCDTKREAKPLIYLAKDYFG